ncbi:auxin-responsive protein SAUR76-like [Lycium barbarum]|uniref:auxin-responsive protein SAUR76-like n=1 Tax=Lycium barbarum TaxID=112863 RepID=UPI00293E82E9|nr:auxin-responsive protein SAUR76-like [Lycium barbarum]
MAKGLTKLKSVLKKMQSLKLGRTTNVMATNNSCSDDDSYSYSYESNCCNSKDLHPVYVGKSRRQYLVSSNVVCHPLFRELVERSDDSEDSVAIACEVVLFQHLLWMLENADPQPESLDELVEFYTAC